MSLTIYQLPHSPFCIPITAALRTCGVAFETRDVPNWDRREIIELTGGTYYQVPLLVDDGKLVFESTPDSQDVARYVDRTFAGGRLFPEKLEGLQAIVVDFLENDVEGVTFRLVDPFYVDSINDLVGRTMTIRHKERKFGRGCVEAWRRDAVVLRAQADCLLGRFEQTLQHSRFLFGDAPVYADFLLLGVIGNMTWNGWNTLSDAQPALKRWQAELQAFRW
jgi:glutathione S-transferase